MQIPVIVELIGPGYRARCRFPVAAEATGDTRYEATTALEAELRKLGVPEPFELLPLEVTADQPWIAAAGSIPDDDLTDQWLDAVAEFRREQGALDQAGLPPAQTPQPTP